MAPLDIPRLTIGDRVQHELLVRERDDKTTKTGDPFVILKLGNATGQLTVNVWKEFVPLMEGVRPGQVVQVIGSVESYRGAKQLKLTTAPRVVAQSAANADEFLPRLLVDERHLHPLLASALGFARQLERAGQAGVSVQNCAAGRRDQRLGGDHRACGRRRRPLLRGLPRGGAERSRPVCNA